MKTTHPFWRVLVLSASTPRAIAIAQSLYGCKEVSLFAADEETSDVGSYLFRHFFTLPPFPSPECLPALLSLIKQHEIRFLFSGEEEPRGWPASISQALPIPLVPLFVDGDDLLKASAQGQNLALQALYQLSGTATRMLAPNPPIPFIKTLDYRFLNIIKIDALYIDFDETLVLNGRVNTMLIALIYQCRNDGIPVTLLTKHPQDIMQSLQTHHLHGLFDRIEHMPPDALGNKADYIHEIQAVLIDDSFQERFQAKQAKPSLRCFDAAGALCLLDRRA